MRVSPDDIINFNNLYLKYKTYAEVARQTGFSASTVKKYIIAGYTPAEEVEKKKFEGELPPFNGEVFRKDDWSEFICYRPGEKEEIEEMWKEVDF